MSVKRVYVEKKPEFAVKAHELQEEISSYLGIQTAGNVRVLIRYDIEKLSEETYQAALGTIFSEPPVDFQRRKETWYSLWNIFRASLTKGQIQPNSV